MIGLVKQARGVALDVLVDDNIKNFDVIIRYDQLRIGIERGTIESCRCSFEDRSISICLSRPRCSIEKSQVVILGSKFEVHEECFCFRRGWGCYWYQRRERGYV